MALAASAGFSDTEPAFPKTTPSQYQTRVNVTNPSQLAVACAIANVESSRYPNARNGDHIGLWQLDSTSTILPANMRDPAVLVDPAENAKGAKLFFDAQGFENAWLKWEPPGKWKLYLPSVTNAIQKYRPPSAGYSGTIESTLTERFFESHPKTLSKVSAMASIGNLAAHLADPALWRRIGIGAAGVLIVLVGVLFLTAGEKANVVSTVTKAVA